MKYFTQKTIYLGHYIALLNMGLKEQCYEFNDSSVTIIENGLLIDKAYIQLNIKENLI